ncbi:hypothetical protein BVRB_6g131330 [Beta vulgaris subsp. vulgaris]|nr:hypothetical protein BVRB_6g131330 [Beta vulgaris subsp. vulgaris]
MNQNRDTTGVHISKLHYPCSCRQLKKKPWRQQYKQRHCHHYRPPIYHHLSQCYEMFISEKHLSRSEFSRKCKEK